MKFVHIADMHFDIPFALLQKNELGEQRRLDQRNVFKKVIQYINENNIEYLFICGDFYEHEYVKQSTIEFINNQFKQIQNTKIYIVPGNHDPITLNSYYNKYNWSENVFIFDENIKKIENDNINIYGYGFNNFYLNENKISKLEIDKEKINILLTHSSVDASQIEEKNYNPLSTKELEELGMDYIALGHIHKPSEIKENLKIMYCGSPLSLGFDEPGEHGMIVGEILDNKKLNLEFIKLDEKEFVEEKIDISEISTKEELIEYINTKEFEENNYYKINLIGNRNFQINTYEILKYITHNNIIKIKDNTSINIPLEKIACENSLKGIFVKNILNKIKQEPQNEEKYLQAIQIGLEALE